MSEFDIADSNQARFDNYLEAEIPDPRDKEVEGFLHEIGDGRPLGASELSMRSSESGRRVMRSYAERAASRSVRESDPHRLIDASVALVVGGLGENALEAIMRMSLIEDAARRLGAELSGVLDSAATLVGHPGSVSLMLWLARTPEDRTLASMGFDFDEDSARYRFS
jgi:hypothetical protein